MQHDVSTKRHSLVVDVDASKDVDEYLMREDEEIDVIYASFEFLDYTVHACYILECSDETWKKMLDELKMAWTDI